MYANYHTHTYRCMHATGTPREYVEAAIEGGFKILGFSDHVPYPFSSGHISGIKMAVEETADYVSEIQELREEYKDRIKLFIGYEAEYYPVDFKAMLENIKKYECDYLILGQHWIDMENDGDATIRNKTPGIAKRHADRLIEAMQTGLFSYIAHPDMVYDGGSQDEYKKHMTRICEAAKELKIPLEINMLGLINKRIYPNKKFWEIAKKVGNDVIIGCDAHQAEHLSNKEYHKTVCDFANSFGFKPLKELEFRKIK